MKALQGLLLSLCFLFAMPTAYADCMDDNGGCGESVCSECECTDPVCSRGNNPCLSKSECCEAFGNIGAR